MRMYFTLLKSQGSEMSRIKTNLKAIREEQGITQKELAERVGVRRETIVHLEGNKYNPSLELAMEICEFLDVAVEEIFTLEKEDTKKLQ